MVRVKKTVSKTAWDRVKIARDPQRPHIYDFIRGMCSDFEELHGDRLVNDDRGLVAGLATIRGEKGAPGVKCLILGHHKGATLEENQEANFGMAQPDGYRKAMRLAKLAEKFHLPVVTFVDTPGAYPGDTAEARGQAEAIAKSLEFFAALATPVVTIVTGEGGSGGALAIAVADRILMLENAIFSVISPEGCAGILWRDGAKAPEAAAALGLTADDLKRLGVADGIIAEPRGGAAKNPAKTIENVRVAILNALAQLQKVPASDLAAGRYRKFRAMGSFQK